MTPDGLGRGPRALPRRAARRATASATTDRAASRCATTTSWCCFNAHHDDDRRSRCPRCRARGIAWLDTAIDTALDRAATPPAALGRRSAELSAAGPLARAAAPSAHAGTPMKRAHAMPFGAEVLPDGGVALPAVGAGARSRCVLELGARRRRGRACADAARRATAGTSSTLPTRGAGDALPLPARRTACACPTRPRAATPTTCTAPSVVVDPRAFDWQRRRLARPAVGRGGDLRAARRHLHARGHVRRGARAPRLTCVELGVTAIELMPLADFPGPAQLGLRRRAAVRARRRLRHARRPQAPGRRGARARADGAARRGLQPLRTRGQLPARVRPQFFNPAHQTPWGAAINFDGERLAHGARLLRPQRALLARGVPLRRPAPGCGARHPRRLAAAHRARDLRRRCAHGPGRERHVHLVLENDRNEARLLERDDDGAPLAGTAQWNDDLHHALHVLLTGETRRLLRRLRASGRWRASAARWPKASPTRASLRPSATASRAASRARTCRPTAFVVVPAEPRPGRQPRVRRAPRRAGRPGALRAGARPACCSSPHVPMLFMGEEFAASHAVPVLLRLRARAGRGRARGPARGVRPLRGLRTTRRRARAFPTRTPRRPSSASKLRWDERELAAARRPPGRSPRSCWPCASSELVPRCWRAQRGAGRWTAKATLLRWSDARTLGSGATLHLLANFGAEADGARGARRRAAWSIGDSAGGGRPRR